MEAQRLSERTKAGNTRAQERRGRSVSGTGQAPTEAASRAELGG